jgi:hypothetical protein
MKKFFAITTAVLGYLVAGAQAHHDAYSSHAEFGLKAGLNIANLHVQNSSSPDAKAGFNAGALAHIHLTKHFAVQPEIMYSNQGAKQTVSNSDYKVNLHYINVPVLAQFMVDDGFRIETGPQLGILASARSKVEGTSTDIKDNYKTADFAWVFGLGYVTHSGFGVDARYNLGISNINNTSGTNVNNRVFQAGVFYQFRRM